jgi:hypothetical protein
VEPGTGTFVEAASFARRITFNGPGGVVIGHKREPRSVNWSHAGRLCPFDTPLGKDVGITLFLAGGARVEEFGQIASRCLRVDCDGKNPRVMDEEAWVTPWHEADKKVGWIAFPDERDDLEQGREVWAHRGQAGVQRVAASQVTHIHTCEEDMISPAASLVPYRSYNDALRVVMACSFLRQALPLRQAAAPQVATGAECRLPRELTFHYGEFRDQSLALGLDLLVGYLPWKGWNFEDAIVISTSTAEKLTSLHSHVLGPYQLQRSLVEQHEAIKGLVEGAFDRERLDDDGIVRKGTLINQGDPVIVQPVFQWGAARPEEIEVFSAPIGCHGEVKTVTHAEGADGCAFVAIVVDEPRPAETGDKLANRHGHKGVISRVLSDKEMPYVLEGEASRDCPCGERQGHRHLEVLINPLSVLSRMNLGQLMETIRARAGSFLDGKPERIACFDPALPLEARKLGGDVLVGFQHVMKLDHNAADKLHARSTDPRAYSAFAEQPLGGRRLNGGQRMGEMEVWALAAHGAPALLEEMLTLKSDNPWARRDLVRSAIDKTQNAYPELPAALRTWLALCRGLGLDLTLQNNKGNRIDPSTLIHAHQVSSVKISLLDTAEFETWGEVETPEIRGGEFETEENNAGVETAKNNESAPRLLTMRYHPNGLASEQIFGPVEDHSCACGRYRRGRLRGEEFNPREKAKHPNECDACHTPLVSADERRHRMGHIELAKPVPNPYLLFTVPFFVKGGLSIGFSYDVAGCQATIDGIFDGATKVHIREMDWLPNAINLVAVLAESVAEVRSVAKALIESNDAGTTATRSPQEFFAGLCAAYKIDPKKCSREQVERMVDNLLEKAGLHAVDLALKIVDAAQIPGATLQRLPVIPPALRPDMVRRNEITVMYQHVMHTNRDLTAAIKKTEAAVDYSKARTAQFLAIARLMCNQRLPLSHRSSDWSGVLPRQRRSISSLLSGKNGLLVGNLLGKRVDFSGTVVGYPSIWPSICTSRWWRQNWVLPARMGRTASSQALAQGM